MTHPHTWRSRIEEGERRRRERRTGTEPATAKTVSLRLKAWLAFAGLMMCAVLAVLLWINGLHWLAIPMLLLALLAVADLVWLRWKQRHGYVD